jgi:lipid II isoglutaminyl synthase (glutamine-hydrolysing)
MTGTDLVIVHLYPDLLMTYGDRGNVLTLARRAEWRGFKVQIAGVTRGEPFPDWTDLIVIGGGSDRVQSLIGDDLAARGQQLSQMVAGGTVILAVCGGYQLMGHSYVAVDGSEVPGLGLMDLTTTAGTDRIIGRVRAKATFDGKTFDVTGFENHAGRTHLGEGSAALAAVAKGQGNNGEDGTEGAVQHGIVGTYLHGPVLPTSPALADALLGRALRRVNGREPLATLDDRLEEVAAKAAQGLHR